MSKEEYPVGSAPIKGSDTETSPIRGDAEKGAVTSDPTIHGDLPSNREVDFMTRNGLNLRSFQKRTLSLARSLVSAQ